MSTITTPPAARTVHTFHCDYGRDAGKTVSTTLEAQEVLRIFHRTAGGENWLWYWLVKHAEANKHRMPSTTPHEAPPPPPYLEAQAFVSDSFLFALGMGLKRPMIRLHSAGKRYKLYLSPRGTVCIKAGHLAPDMSVPAGQPNRWTNDPTGDEEYIGCLVRGNLLLPRPDLGNGRRGPERPLEPTERATLTGLAQDPAGFLAACAKDMDRCWACGAPLEDDRSKQARCGQTCAERFGVPWGRAYDEKVPSFAQLWSAGRSDDRASVRGLCLSIRQARSAWAGKSGDAAVGARQEEEILWSMLGDALADMGMTTRPAMPDAGARMPVA